MTDPTTCLALAPLLTLIVGALKRIPFVRKFPKVVAAIIAGVVAAFRAAHPETHSIDLGQLAECLALLLSGAIATQEIVVKPVANQFAVGLRADDFPFREKSK
jgi:hypothetical protein